MRCPHCHKLINEAHRTVEFSESNVQRFWKHVEKTEGGCWICSLQPSGIYARISVNGRTVCAHVFSYILHFGTIPEGKKICHSCDTPRCVNPDHLEAKSQTENMIDMIGRGRGKRLKGEKNPRSKLSDIQVEEVRRHLLNKTKSIKQLAQEHKVSFQSIYQIGLGKTRGSEPVISVRPIRRLSKDDVFKIREMGASSSFNQADIAAAFGVGQHHVSRILSGKRRRDVPLNPTPRVEAA